MPYTEDEIRRAFPAVGPEHKRIQVDEEHGGQWVTCLGCGGQWSVNESNKGPDFEQVSDGDESCL